MGVFFTLLSIYLSAKPFSIGTFPVFAPYGIIITGFLAGDCFCVSAYLVKKLRMINGIFD
jgi:hypothetical protein